MEGLKILRTSLTTVAAEQILRTGVEAGQYGISYWATILSVKRRGDYGIRQLRLADTVEAKTFMLSARDIASAVNRMFRDPKGTHSLVWTQKLLTDDLDGPLAEAIIQVACFGKVIYG